MKNILYITNHNPFGISYGAEQRSHILLKSFLNNGCKVDIVYIGEMIPNPINVDENVSIVYWNNGDSWPISKIDSLKRLYLLKMFPSSKRLISIIDELLKTKDYDFIACRYLQFAALAGLECHADKLILDIDDMPAQAISAHLSPKTGIRNIYQKLMLKRIQSETDDWIRRSYTCFLPNSEQANQYNCRHLPNIPILQPTQNISFGSVPNILFVGKLDWRPNYEGVAHFIRNCWPSIISQRPDASFIIAGKGLPQSLKDEFLGVPNVQLLGFVANIIDFYNKGNIIVSPIYSGAGTNIKVAEAMAMGKACVLTPFSAKGYEKMLHDGENVFIANNDDEMVSKTLTLLNSEQLCMSIMHKARSLAVSHLSQARVDRIIDELVNN